MDAEIKAKLEEMANKVDALTLPFAFMTGAQAAWTLAVEWERKRIIDKLTYQCECCDLEQRLTPKR